MSWGSLGGGGRDLAEQALPEPRWREAEWTAPLSQSIRVWLGEGPPRRGWMGELGSGSSPPVCARSGLGHADCSGDGLPPLGSLCPFTPVPGPMAELQPGSRPFRVSVQGQLQSAGEWQAGWDTLQGHFRREAGAVAATDLPLPRGKPCPGIKHLMCLH